MLLVDLLDGAGGLVGRLEPLELLLEPLPSWCPCPNVTPRAFRRVGTQARTRARRPRQRDEKTTMKTILLYNNDVRHGKNERRHRKSDMRAFRVTMRVLIVAHVVHHRHRHMAIANRYCCRSPIAIARAEGESQASLSHPEKAAVVLWCFGVRAYRAREYLAFSPFFLTSSSRLPGTATYPWRISDSVRMFYNVHLQQKVRYSSSSCVSYGRKTLVSDGSSSSS